MTNRFLNTSASDTPEVTTIDPRQMTGVQLRDLGVSQLAYVKAVVHDGEDAFAIHAADGTPMALADDFGSAVEAIIDHEMIPIWVH